MKKTYLFLTFLIFTISMSGCGKKQVTEDETDTTEIINDEKILTDICINECKNALNLGRNLDNGPCLLNPIKENNKLVCDVAHSPRESIDNIPENQCSSFREEKSNRFIEVTPDCEFLKIG